MKDWLARAWKHIESLGYKPYYLAVYGSQNYWLDIDTEEYKSDVDYKCIIIPTLDELIWNSKPVSCVTNFESWQIDIKDIRAYTESVVKCNVNFLEILCTPYYICSDKHTPIRDMVYPLMKEMWQFYLKACYGMMLEKYEALRHPYPSTQDKIAKFWYDPKQLHHIIRLRILMERYVRWSFPWFEHTWQEQNYLKEVKRWLIMDKDVDYIADIELKKAKAIRDSYIQEPVFITKKEIIEFSYLTIKENIWNNSQK